MVGPLRTPSTTPLRSKRAGKLQVIEATAVFLALGMLNDSVLSWLRLDVVMSAPWRWPLFWLLSLIALTLLARDLAARRHAAPQNEQQRKRSALERLQF